MEANLRCNSLKCRRDLNDHAVVTTCSHIFCLDCSSQLQLSSPPDGQRPICPACDTRLLNHDDAVIANLNPTEDYKTSVLSGLSPTVIMECAGRALSFWAYQTTQEIVYQEYLARSLTEKYKSLNLQMDKTIHEANSEILDLRNKLGNMHVDQEKLCRKHEDLQEAFRDKSRKYLQTQELYDKLKRRALLGQVQNAASSAVDHTIQESAISSRFVDQIGHTSQLPPPPHFNETRMQNPSGGGIRISPQNLPPNFTRSGITGGWNGLSSQENIQRNNPMQTPSSHRHQVSSTTSARHVLQNLPNTQKVGNSQISREFDTGRSPLSQLNTNISLGGTGFVGYGMSAGMKVSSLPGNSHSAIGTRPGVRGRVAQRPASAFTSGLAPNLGPLMGMNGFTNGDGYY